MKNNLLILFLITTCFLSCENEAHSSDLVFNTPEMKILNNGNTVIAGNGTVASSDNKIKLDAESFNYDKITSII